MLHGQHTGQAVSTGGYLPTCCAQVIARVRTLDAARFASPGASSPDSACHVGHDRAGCIGVGGTAGRSPDSRSHPYSLKTHFGYLDLLAQRRRKVDCYATLHACSMILASFVAAPPAQLTIGRAGQCVTMLRDAGIPPASIQVVLHGIDTDYFHPSPDLLRRRLEGGTFTVLFVGSYRRDFERLGRICALLAAHQGMVIRIVAPASAHQHLPRASNILLLGRLSDAELRTEYQSANCLLMPIEAATANNAVLEAPPAVCR